MLTQSIKFLTILFILPTNSTESTETNMKFILVWTTSDKGDYPPPFNETHRDLQNDPFVDQSCEYQNCFYTSYRGLFNSVADFDAVLFYGFGTAKATFPKERDEFQYYVYVMDEPSVYFKMEMCYMNDFFNVTATFKLDSDIPWPYFKVIDKTDSKTRVGPRIDMEWKESPKVLSKEYLSKLYGKTELAAWFVSRCNTVNNRGSFAHSLQQEIMARSNLRLDIYGGCSFLKCPSPELPTNEHCNRMLGEKYLFYLAFESCDIEDYVTEKVLRALQNDVVPVVYGGANYSRFLPPGSYIDAEDLGPEKTAIVMIYLYTNRDAYSKFFYWKNTYEYRDNVLGFTCGLCAILNSNSSKVRTHPRFTDWWHDRNTSSSSHPNDILCTSDSSLYSSEYL